MNVHARLPMLLAIALVLAWPAAAGAQSQTNACAQSDVLDEALSLEAHLDRVAEAPEVTPSGDEASASPDTGGSTQVVDNAVKPKMLAIAADAGLSETGGATTVSITPFAWIAAVHPEVRTDQDEYQKHELARRFGGKVSFGGKGDAFDRDGDGAVDEALDAKNETDIVTYELSWRFLGTTDRRDASNWEPYFGRVRAEFGGDVGAAAASAAEIQALQDINRIRAQIIAPPGGGRVLDPDHSAEDCDLLRGALAANPEYRAKLGELSAAREDRAKRLAAVDTAWLQAVDSRLVMSLVASGTEREPEYGGDKLAIGLRANRGFSMPGASLSFQLDYLKNELPNGADELEGVKLGLDYKQLLPGLADAFGWQDPTFSFAIAAERYSDVPADAHDSIATAAAKLSIGAGKNIRIPISLKWANRTDLLADEDDVIAHIGISYDFDAFKPSK